MGNGVCCFPANSLSKYDAAHSPSKGNRKLKQKQTVRASSFPTSSSSSLLLPAAEVDAADAFYLTNISSNENSQHSKAADANNNGTIRPRLPSASNETTPLTTTTTGASTTGASSAGGSSPGKHMTETNHSGNSSSFNNSTNKSNSTYGSRSTNDGGNTEVDIRGRNNRSSRNTQHSDEQLAEALNHIFYLCEAGIAPTVAWMLVSYAGLDAMINTAHRCHILDVEMQLTPLQLASACGHSQVVSTLLDCPAIRVNDKEAANSMTALHFAVSLGQVAVVEVLCKDVRVNTSARDVDGKTPLHLAVELGEACAVETLLRMTRGPVFAQGLDLLEADSGGNTVLHTMALFPNCTILRLLLGSKSNQAELVALLQARNRLGFTAQTILAQAADILQQQPQRGALSPLSNATSTRQDQGYRDTLQCLDVLQRAAAAAVEAVGPHDFSAAAAAAAAVSSSPETPEAIYSPAIDAISSLSVDSCDTANSFTRAAAAAAAGGAAEVALSGGRNSSSRKRTPVMSWSRRVDPLLTQSAFG